MLFQSTHPHGVRHNLPVCEMEGVHVSIHAPARGATAVASPTHKEEQVSIHAPARGATIKSFSIIHSLIRFNPRTRTGCDPHLRYFSQPDKRFQSTHPHGVRPFKGGGVSRLSSFNPRTRTGCDLQVPCACSLQVRVSIHAPARGATDCEVSPNAHAQFQSTHPHGVRPWSANSLGGKRRFNPRTRTGCDVRASVGHSAEEVSIHAPARGAT